MADEHFFPGPGDFPSGLGAAPFFASPYAPPPGLDAACAAAMQQGFGGLAWADLQLMADSSAAATTATAHFDSALSSLVSSPAQNGSGGGGYGYAGDDVAIGDLIGRLGSICSAAGVAASANNSCYSTPLSSPPRGASPSAAAAALAFRGGGCGYPGAGGAAAAALETAGTGRLSRVASSKSLGTGAVPPALESPEAEASRPKTGGCIEMRDPVPAPPAKGAARKRKASGKGKATSAATTAAATAGNASPKRPKVAADGGAEDDEGKDTAVAEAEPAKDYIHVRARRGQATDSHSLAERVRRERISERMKMLQSLVPGCNKITGKALMLDEIINYVQSLQRQVEFLSMKLATMNPELDEDARYQAATEMLASSHPPAAAAFSSYAAELPFVVGGGAHTAQLDSFSGWEVQDLESVVLRHSHTTATAAVDAHSHDLFYASPSSSSPPAHNNFHGQRQQGTATASHMKLEQQ